MDHHSSKILKKIFLQTFGLFMSLYYMVRKGTYIHTNIHNWPLQPFSQDYGLASHTTFVVCVNFIREWRDLQFNVDSERQIFEKLFRGRFIYSQSFCQKSAAERKSPKKYFSYFVFDNWPGIRNQAFASNKPTHYLLDHDDNKLETRSIILNEGL